MLRKKLFIGALALGVSSLAFANGYAPAPAPEFTPGVYLGIMGGYALNHWGDMTGTETIFDQDVGFKVTDENGFAGRAFLGYDFHPNFALEGGFTYLFNTPTLKTDPGSVKLFDVKNTYAIDLVGKIKAKVADQFGLFAKLGGAYLHRDVKFAGDGSLDKGIFSLVYGAGASYDIMPNLTTELSWTRYSGNHKVTSNSYTPDIDLFALGIYYKFNLENL